MSKNDIPLVSFILTAYNEENHLSDCIDSCLAQTYQNIEIIIVNDGSSDRTQEICEHYLEKYDNISAVEFQQNQGKIVGFNTAYSMASGEYICISGADDINLTNRVEDSLAGIGRASMLCSNMLFINDRGKKIDKSLPIYEENDFSLTELILSPKVWGPTIFLTKKVCEEIFPLDLRLGHEDWYIPVRAASIGTVRYLDTPLVEHRVHSGNSSQNNHWKGGYKKWFYLATRNEWYYEYVLDLIESKKLNIPMNEIEIRLYKTRYLLSTKKLSFILENYDFISRNNLRLRFVLMSVSRLYFIVHYIRRVLSSY